ncbi:MAG: serine/threonine-protein kinase PknK [Sandaracinaceae bacterium]
MLDDDTEPRADGGEVPPEAPGYAFGDRVGVGGMGEVFRAVQLATGREVAVKVLREKIAREGDSAQRLLAEASAIARLRHRNVVELLDVTRTSNTGRPMIVLELVDGGDLSSWQGDFVGWDQVRAALDDVLAGLSAAHGAQLVHADLKPTNLLLGRDGSVKISDFGIARWQNPLHRTTGPFSILGTPEYMAPEQILPDGHVGPWTDLYALGVMLYEWLGVRTPFSAAPDLPSLLRAKLTMTPPPIEPKPGVEIPPQVSELARQLLALEPRERPRFASQLRAALRAALPARSPLPEVRPERSGSWFPSAHDPSLALPTTLPLIGRRNERLFLENQVEAVQTSARPRLVLVRGPAGIGKSHLALWAFGEVERRGWMEGLAAGFDVDGGAHSDGLRHALRRLLGAPAGGDDPLDGPWRWLRDGDATPFPGREVLAWIRSDRAFTGAERAAELAAQVLVAATRARPVYLWLDDLLWSRDGTAELVDRLLETESAAVLIVGTVRTGTADHASVKKRLDRWLAHPSTSYIHLGPLDAVERAELAQAVLPLDPAFAKEVGATLTEETPLEIVQSLTHWFERGWLAGEPGELKPTGKQTLATLRRGARDLFDERLRAILMRTPDVVERALITAALLGDPFEAELLYAALPDTKDRVDMAIEWALLRGLWRSVPGGAMRFDHHLLRTAALDRLMNRADAAQLQRQAADGLSAARDLAVPSVGVKVSEMYLAAGERALASATLMHTGRAIARAGANERAPELWAGFGEWVERADDPRVFFDHRLLRAAIDYFAGRYDRCERGIREALAAAEDFDDPDRVANARLLMASLAFRSRRYEETRAIASELAEVDDDAAPRRVGIAIHAHFRLAELAGLREDWNAAAATYERVERLLPHANDRALVHRSAAQRALIAILRGELDEADALVERALEGYREDGDTDDVPDVLAIATRLKWARGELAVASHEALSRVREVRALGDSNRLTSALITLALVDADSGSEQLGDSIERLLEAFAEAPREEPFEVWALLRLAVRLRALGHPHAAEVDRLIAERRQREGVSPIH